MVSACKTSTVDNLIHCPYLRGEFQHQAVATCQSLIKQACVASYELNPPYICSKSVPADPYTAIGSAIGSAQALFTAVCVFVTFLLHHFFCKRFSRLSLAFPFGTSTISKPHTNPLHLSLPTIPADILTSTIWIEFVRSKHKKFELITVSCFSTANPQRKETEATD